MAGIPVSRRRIIAPGAVRLLGCLLVLAGIVGFLIVADDLRHKGELLGVGSVLAGGLVLVALSARKGSR